MKKIVEALIFAAPEPINESDISKVADLKKDEIYPIVEQLNRLYDETGRTFRMGQAIRVTVKAVNVARRQINFDVVV